MGASIWMKSSNGPAPMSRPRADTIPALTEDPNPNGLPAAMIQSPTSTARESPHDTEGSGGAPSTLMTAMSVSSSEPSTLAVTSRPSENDTRILSACPTTWLLVTMMPDGSMTKPDPAPCTCSRRLRRRSRNCFSNGVPRRAAGSCVSPPTDSVTAIFTTAGTTRFTSGASDGSAARRPSGAWALVAVQPHNMMATARQSGRIIK